MDNQKTGALIRQLAVTDRAVSKWERGVSLR